MNLCVLIPAKDERLGTGKTVQSVLDAGASARDIYVIDDGFSDGTGEIAKSFGVSVLRNEKNISKAMSIRRITTHFDLTNRYDVICLMDADTEVSKNYFEAVKPKAQRAPTGSNLKMGFRQVLEKIGSSGRTRTYNPPVNSRMLCH